MARVSTIRGAIATAMAAVDVSTYAHGTPDLVIDQTRTGDLLNHAAPRGHLMAKVEPKKTQNLDRGNRGTTVATPIDVQVLFELRQTLGGAGGRESDIDDARDLAEELVGPLVDLEDGVGDDHWNLAYVSHQVQGPSEDGQFVAIRIDLTATHKLGA